MMGIAINLACVALAVAAGEGTTAPPAGDNPKVEAAARAPRSAGRLDLTHTFSVDDQAPRNLSYSDLRGVLDTDDLFGLGALELHFDGRARYSWNRLRDHRIRITDSYLQYGGAADPWTIAAGRQDITTVPGAEIDGVRAGFRLAEGVRLGAFGGLVPNPITGDPQADFVGGGLEYEARHERINHAGGAMVQTFKGDLERLFISERLYARLGDDWSLFGLVVVDLYAARGLFADLNKIPTASQSFGDRIDLTRANVNLRYKPARWFDVAFNASHNHTILPNAWWQSYLALLEAQRGFAIDGPEQVGTRVTSLRLTANVRLPVGFTPYARARWDRRHTQVRDGFEGRGGIKWRSRDLWADGGYSFRHHFRVESHLVRLDAGATFARSFGGDVGAAMVESSAYTDTTSQVVVDLHAHLFWDIGAVINAFDGVRLLIQYQGYLEEQAMLHLFVGRVGYHFDTGR